VSRPPRIVLAVVALAVVVFLTVVMLGSSADDVDVANPAAGEPRTVREALDSLDDRCMTWAITLLVVL
jgi:hypothetical protein